MPTLLDFRFKILDLRKRSSTQDPRSKIRRKSRGFTLIELLVACHPKPRRKKAILGFTLIELLVVIAIIGILTAIGTVAYSSSQQRSRDLSRKKDLVNIKTALELVRYDFSSYPLCDGQGPGDALCAVSNTSTNPDLTPKYMAKVPQDPGGSGGIYSYISVGCSGTPLKCASYVLLACLENANDPQKDNPKHPACPKASYTIAYP